MHLCRCPYCRTTFQLSVPPDSAIWEHTPFDEDGLLMWVCLDCHRRGHAPVTTAELHDVGHDTSHQRHAST